MSNNTIEVGTGLDHETIQEGLDAAYNGDTVVIHDGTYTGPKNKNLDFKGKKILVKSKNGPDKTIIDCENDGRGFIFQNGETEDSILAQVTIRNGYALRGMGHGGGIAMRKSSPALRHVWIESCRSDTHAGGIHCDNASPLIFNCIIDHCVAEKHAGGIDLYGSGCSNAVLWNNSIRYCSAESAGGLYVVSANGVAIKGNTFYANEAKTKGGAVLINFGARVYFTQGSIGKNISGEHGGGIYIISGGFVSLDGVYINENEASCGGGAVSCFSTDSRRPAYLVCADSIFLQNKGKAGGAIRLYKSLALVFESRFVENEDYAIFIHQDTVQPIVSSCDFIDNKPEDMNY